MLPSYHYSYLTGTLIFWLAWVACFVVGKAYRSEMRWGTLIAAPMALTSLLFVPQYWTPPSLFNLDEKIRVVRPARTMSTVIQLLMPLV
jgi:hypothetical protein